MAKRKKNKTLTETLQVNKCMYSETVEHQIKASYNKIGKSEIIKSKSTTQTKGMKVE